jgi:hypothetical protein
MVHDKLLLVGTRRPTWRRRCLGRSGFCRPYRRPRCGSGLTAAAGTGMADLRFGRVTFSAEAQRVQALLGQVRPNTASP